MKDNPKVAIIQHPPVYLNKDATLQKAVGFIRDAAANDAKIIVFPETWFPGYPVWLDEAPEVGVWDHEGAKQLYRLLFENAFSLDDDEAHQLQDLADSLGVFIVVGAHERVGNSLFCSEIYFSPGDFPQSHRKLMPTYTERMIWGLGDGSTLEVVNTPYGTLGGLICWEHWMPLARAAMHAKGEAIHAALWPGLTEMQQVASQHYAFEGRCFVLAAGAYVTVGDVLDGLASLDENAKAAEELLTSMGPRDKVLKPGNSTIYAPDGSIVAQLGEETGVLYATLDLNMISENLMTLDTDGHYSRPDVFELKVDTKRRSGVVFD